MHCIFAAILQMSSNGGSAKASILFCIVDTRRLDSWWFSSMRRRSRIHKRRLVWEKALPNDVVVTRDHKGSLRLHWRLLLPPLPLPPALNWKYSRGSIPGSAGGLGSRSPEREPQSKSQRKKLYFSGGFRWRLPSRLHRLIAEVAAAAPNTPTSPPKKIYYLGVLAKSSRWFFSRRQSFSRQNEKLSEVAVRADEGALNQRRWAKYWGVKQKKYVYG